MIPITYTVRFVKLNGASVVFSKSETIYTGMTAPTADFFMPGGKEIKPENVAKLKAAIMTDGLQMVQRHVDAAAKGFAPKQSAIDRRLLFCHGAGIAGAIGEAATCALRLG